MPASQQPSSADSDSKTEGLAERENQLVSLLTRKAISSDTARPDALGRTPGAREGAVVIHQQFTPGPGTKGGFQLVGIAIAISRNERRK